MLIYDKKLKVFYSTLINDEKFFSAFATKEIGDARNLKNIFRFVDSLFFSYRKIIIMNQIHSANVFFYKASSFNPQIKVERIDDVDGVVTCEKEIFLTVRTADCVPIIFVDKKNQLIGISHQGWRGSLKKMVWHMINMMESHGGKKSEIICAIGPAIGSCCYRISEDRYFQFLNEFTDFKEKIFFIRGKKIFLSLSYLNYLLLLEKGVKKENIDFFPFCTFCDKKRFFSFRRDYKKNYGEMLSLVIQK